MTHQIEHALTQPTSHLSPLLPPMHTLGNVAAWHRRRRMPIKANFFERAYTRLTEGCDVEGSLKEPLSREFLNAALDEWLPAGRWGRFMSGEFTCLDVDAALSVPVNEMDKMFFAYCDSLNDKLRLPHGTGASEPLGIAAIRIESMFMVEHQRLRYEFLVEIPTHCTIPDMKHACAVSTGFSDGMMIHAHGGVGCESVAEWAEALLDPNLSVDYIDSLVKWHWRAPSRTHTRGPRERWAIRRAKSRQQA